MIEAKAKKEKAELKCYGKKEELVLETAVILKNLIKNIAESSDENPVEIMIEIFGYYSLLFEEEEE